MIPPSFEYHRPASVEEAVGYCRLGSGSENIGRWCSLLPMMKLQLASLSTLLTSILSLSSGVKWLVMTSLSAP